MRLRGTVVDAVDTRTVSTGSGPTDLAEVPIRRTTGETTRVTLWEPWTESAAHLEEGMELLVTNASTDEFRGETTYATSSESSVVVEPEVLVTVTTIREWADCPRLPYLGALTGVPLNYPVVKGTLVHEVFGDLLRGRDRDDAIADRVDGRGLELGLLDVDRETAVADVQAHAEAIEAWLDQGRLGDDEWRSEQLLISDTVGIRGRADAVRNGAPVELKTGKNLRAEPRFKDKVQAACYALLLEEHGDAVDTATLLYTKNATVPAAEADGDRSPAKDFSVNRGLLRYVVQLRNHIAAMRSTGTTPTGHEGDATCEYCFEQETCMAVAGRLAQESKAGMLGSALPEAERELFDRLYRAIEQERRAIHRAYASLWEDTAEERAADDRAMIDLEPLESQAIDDGRWELRSRIETRGTAKIREGDLVLASDGEPIGGHAELARVERLGAGPDGNQVVLTADEPVAVSRLDTYPSDISSDRLLVALHDALLRSDERRRDVLLGRATPTVRPVDETIVPGNAAQDRAVKLALGAEDFAIIHGPPGTGKTYTIARAVERLVERGDRVLLSAYTNRAVDNALEAVLDRGVESVCRIGSEQGIRADMLSHRLRTEGDPAARVEELEGAQVVAATTASCGSRVTRTQSFDVAIVDEAAQLTEPGTYAAINRADRFVLVGDHQQLPPVVRSEGDLSTSLFERLVDRAGTPAVRLEQQYRMNQRIQAFPSREFYEGSLRPATEAIAGQTLADLPSVTADALPVAALDPVSFIAVEGDTEAHVDHEEAAEVARTVEQFVDAGVDPASVGVIAPYRAQVSTIEPLVTDAVVVDTVDRFQGSSKEVIVVSFVATGGLEGPIFEDYRRLNVALTRAKRALVLVGDPRALESDQVYNRMLEWATRSG